MDEPLFPSKAQSFIVAMKHVVKKHGEDVKAREMAPRTFLKGSENIGTGLKEAIHWPLEEDDTESIKQLKAFYTAGAHVVWHRAASYTHYQTFLEGASLTSEKKMRPHLVDSALLLIAHAELAASFEQAKCESL